MKIQLLNVIVIKRRPGRQSRHVSKFIIQYYFFVSSGRNLTKYNPIPSHYPLRYNFDISTVIVMLLLWLYHECLTLNKVIISLVLNIVYKMIISRVLDICTFPVVGLTSYWVQVISHHAYYNDQKAAWENSRGFQFWWLSG